MPIVRLKPRGGGETDGKHRNSSGNSGGGGSGGVSAEVDWAGGIRSAWQFGEAGARLSLDQFMEHGVYHFESSDDRSVQTSCTRLPSHPTSALASFLFEEFTNVCEKNVDSSLLAPSLDGWSGETLLTGFCGGFQPFPTTLSDLGILLKSGAQTKNI